MVQFFKKVKFFDKIKIFLIYRYFEELKAERDKKKNESEKQLDTTSKQ